jgi:meso-butanediol dehydrogenase/(S,S)-butanediol dehydrogenase/diacetyl reductase
MRIQGKKAIITGAGSGIGKGIAVVMTREGAEVALVDKDYNAATLVARELESLGHRSIAVCADLTRSNEVDEMLKTVLGNFKKVDILVNNAAIRGPVIPVVDYDEGDWDRVISANYKTAFLCSKAVARFMMKQRAGRIINIASTGGKRSSASAAHYGASKHALIGFTQALALELAPYDITVNAVCPGPTDSPMWWNYARVEAQRKGISPESWSENFIKNKIPLGKLNSPEDVGNLVCFLASDEARMITGTAVTISGGMEVL